VAKISLPRIRAAKNPLLTSVVEPKSMPRIDITPRYPDTGPMGIKISSFMNDVG
jgi:hypothetical protein